MFSFRGMNLFYILFGVGVYSFAAPFLRIEVFSLTLPLPILILVTFYILASRINLNSKIDLLTFNLLFFSFLCFVILSGILSGQGIMLAVVVFILKLLTCLTILNITYNFLSKKINLYKAIYFSLLFSSLFLIAHIFISYFILKSNYLSGSLFIVTEQGKNQIAAYLSVMSVLSFCSLNFFKKKKSKVLALFFIIHFIGLMYTFSRSALICALLSIITLFLLQKKTFVEKLHQLTISVLILSALVGLIYPMLPESITIAFYNDINSIFTFQDVGQSTSIEKRTEMIYAALSIFEENFFIGSGPLSFSETVGIASHNTFLQVLSEFGLLGMLSFLSVILYALCYSFLNNRNFFPVLLCFTLTMFFQNVLDLMFLYLILGFSFVNHKRFLDESD